MDYSIPPRLRDVKQQADKASLDHLDVIIDGTAFDYPLLRRLAELEPPPLHALILEGTPEHDLAAEGPVLVRVHWQHTSQIDWLGEFVRETDTQSRALVLLSSWPFDALAKQLRYFTQAHWKKGANSGILRFYDARLFKHMVEVLNSEQRDAFYAPALSWHWMDRDHREQQMDSRHRPFCDFTPPSAPLMLDDHQVESIQMRTAAEQWAALHGLSKRTYWVGKEQEVNQIHLGLYDAKSKHLKGEEHTASMIQWLAQYMPETLPKKEGWF